MRYKAFTQEKMVVTLNDYIKMIVHFTKKGKGKTESRVFRKRFFVTQNSQIDTRNLYNKNSDTYSIYLDEIGTEKLFVEKISNRDGVYYKIREPITRGQYEQISKGKIEWMQKSSLKLLNELYWELKMNQLELSMVYEFTREIVDLGSSQVLFDKDIRHLGHDLLKQESEEELRRLSQKRHSDIVVTYRKNVGMPKFFNDIMANMYGQPQPVLQMG
ncbi:MAG: hypothetical protein ACI4F9_02655 [Lachnospiraceae bacterium]